MLSHLTEGDATVIILPDPGASGTISIVPASRAVIIGEPGEYSSAYDGTVEMTLSRGTGIYGEVMVTWVITPRDTAAFMQVEGSVTFLDLQQTATITLQVRASSVWSSAISPSVYLSPCLCLSLCLHLCLSHCLYLSLCLCYFPLCLFLSLPQFQSVYLSLILCLSLSFPLLSLIHISEPTRR